MNIDNILNTAFTKAMELKDYSNAHTLNTIRLNYALNRITYKEYCEQSLEVLRNCDYMYRERKQMEDILSGTQEGI